MSLCKCGHPRWAHQGPTGRDKCTGDIKVLFHKQTSQKPTDRHLPKDQSEQYLKSLKPARLGRVLKRGYDLIDCNCPTYHLIDLGNVKIVSPGEVKTGLIIKP